MPKTIDSMGGVSPIDIEKRKENPADATELLRQCVVDHPPKYAELPKQIKIDAPIKLSETAKDDQENTGHEKRSICDMLSEFNNLGNRYGIEFGMAVVASPDGKLELGPICEGDEHSVSIGSPLKRTEVVSPSGLIVYRDEIMAAALHNHPRKPVSFSITDLYTYFSDSNNFKQLYVIRSNGVVDLLQVTEESRFVSEETFRRLANLWRSFLTPAGELRDDISGEAKKDFLTRVSRDILKVGYYSNEDSTDKNVLNRLD